MLGNFKSRKQRYLLLKCLWSRDTSKMILLTVTERGWTQWVLLHLMVSGARSLVTVHQPPVLTAVLGRDVTMPCQLNISHDEKMVNSPVLYWVYFKDNTSHVKLWPPTENYQGRVALLDENVNSSDKSILFKSIHWADSGKYLCKLSIITAENNKRSRKTGNGTLLTVYDTMIFARHNDSLLCCSVNVTRDAEFVLSIYHGGSKLQSVDSFSGDFSAALPYVTLSETISLRSGGNYECQLHLNEELVTKSNFHYGPNEPDEEVFPEPWPLYGGLLLVPIVILLILVTALLMHRGQVR
uniref:uncharacterized protein LOC124065467 isoform X2 n=1 Tax=Scatophagus argus TaxID=75038 RepID=UPI001ED7E707|nr:uncharacterized protein LOC124065467 isoform X2 [Scatophagus argus]